jgi:hypothetical protein
MSRLIMQQALDSLKLVYEQVDFSNGVTDPTGTMDEGKVVIGGIVSDAIAALEAELPKPKQDRVSHLRCDFLDHINGAICAMGQTYDRKNLRLTFDGETGKLKSAEVI